jgi:hypothetical protein
MNLPCRNYCDPPGILAFPELLPVVNCVARPDVLISASLLVFPRSDRTGFVSPDVILLRMTP